MTTIRFIFNTSLKAFAFQLLLLAVQATEDIQNGSTIMNAEQELHIEPAHAVLFPSFTLLFGVVTFLVLTRSFKALPYTAVMFLLGTIMGIWVELADDSTDHITESLRLWIPIDSEVLLLVFLPGLIFKDAISLNVHLFAMAILQCIIFAFPLVLAGTVLTAIVAYYIFPYNWSWDLCLAFGSILAATDPVAVTACKSEERLYELLDLETEWLTFSFYYFDKVLEQVGAPPRLKIHIYGESLLNDGSAIVFFSIFSERFFYLLNVEGFGEDIGWVEGTLMFLKKSLGAVVIGIGFGVGLLLLLGLLNHRMSRTENVVEVMAMAAVAYTGFYVADYVCDTSGIIATVVGGVTVKLFGRALVNDIRLVDDFWALVQQILNTILFALGGAVWGSVITRGHQDGLFTRADWGYMVLLYVLFLCIRAFLFMSAYPTTKRIGLSTNVKETVFMVHGGLRGSVAIALALALDNRVHAVGASQQYIDQTTTVFSMIGGVAFMTLILQGVTASPLIRYLGLTRSSESRRKILKALQTRYRLAMVDEMVRLLTQKRFHEVNFALVKHHIPLLRDLTRQQLRDSVEKFRDKTPKEEYVPPYLQRILPYLAKDDEEESEYQKNYGFEGNEDVLHTDANDRVSQGHRNTERRQRQSNIRHMMAEDRLNIKEMRLLFLSIMKAAYERQINDGELVDKEFLTLALGQSLDCAEDDVLNGESINDWNHATAMDGFLQALVKRCINCSVAKYVFKKTRLKLGHSIRRLDIERALAFMEAHRWARDYIQKEFQDSDRELAEEGKLVMSESRCQCEKASAVFDQYGRHDVADVVSHKFCSIVINSAVSCIEKLVRAGLMHETEAEHVVTEMESSLISVRTCRLKDHPGEVPTDLYDDEEEQKGVHRERATGSLAKQPKVEDTLTQEESFVE
jgi:NhaP-type Na+/H+ or K+/H+ antiporter